DFGRAMAGRGPWGLRGLVPRHLVGGPGRFEQGGGQTGALGRPRRDRRQNRPWPRWPLLPPAWRRDGTARRARGLAAAAPRYPLRGAAGGDDRQGRWLPQRLAKTDGPRSR